MEKKKYSISQLASILTISEVAIRKKINEKRYKKRYEVVEENVDGKNTKFILLDDIELQTEIEVSKSNKKKFTGQNNVEETLRNVIKNVDYIEVQPEIHQMNDISENQYLTFTKRYIEDLKNVYETLDATRKETLEKDKQIYMLEDFESRTKQDILELQALNKTLTQKKERYFKAIIWLSITFFIIVLVLSIFLARAYY